MSSRSSTSRASRRCRPIAWPTGCMPWAASDFALYLQSRMSVIFSVDIHPSAQVGRGIMIDHAHDIVIGETAVVEDNVSMLHGVTLGGTGKEDGDRHPKVRHGVLIGAGRQDSGQYRDRPLLACRRGFGGACSRARQPHGGRRAGQDRRLCRMRGAGPVDGPQVRRRMDG